MPFLYPCIQHSLRFKARTIFLTPSVLLCRLSASTRAGDLTDDYVEPHISSDDYSRSIFADKAKLTVSAGSGGNGCISFLREKYIDEGPPNGGDGGSGGSIYVQAVFGETSLHKIARKMYMTAGKGKNGRGKSRGGQRGQDILIQVPVGTVIRETSRYDPIAAAEKQIALHRRRWRGQNPADIPEEEQNVFGRMNKWLVHPSMTRRGLARIDLPDPPYPRRSNLSAGEAQAPIRLDLSRPMKEPKLLIAGAVGGYGNPHFGSALDPKPMLASRGEDGTKITLEFELKLLADVGFVGMPNAGKSTLLRALSSSRARVGHWAFTTLHPNIGTMILDDNTGRAKLQTNDPAGRPRTSISIADIPGLIKDAHLDKGLGLGFLRHVERANVLAFVIDLSIGHPVEQLQSLWRELREFEELRARELSEQTQATYQANELSEQDYPLTHGQSIVVSSIDKTRDSPIQAISSKAWFVVATKADLVKSKDDFLLLQRYLQALDPTDAGALCGSQDAWRGPYVAIPISAKRGEGLERIPDWIVELLSEQNKS